jgi:hypothetical protein
MAANLTMTGTPYLADPHAPVRFTAPAGSIAITAGMGVYLHTDGTFRPVDKTVVTIANVSKWYGIVINNVSIGAPITAFGIGSKIYMTDTNVAIGSFWYVSATVGAFYDAAVATADTYLPCIKFITAHVAEVVRGGV